MLTQEDLEIVQQMIANATAGPDRTGAGSGLSRKSLKDAFRKDNLRNPRRLDWHYAIADQSLLTDQIVTLDPYASTVLPTSAPSPAVPFNEILACESGVIECLGFVAIKEVASLFVEVYLNGVSAYNDTITVPAAVVPVITNPNLSYSTGDRIALAVTNLDSPVTELFMEVTMLRKERFTA